MNSLFPLGQTIITPGAGDALVAADVQLGLTRHATGDWGAVDQHDKAANDSAVFDLTRIVSAYTDRRGRRFWIITEADRTTTTVLLPDEY